MLNGFMHVCVSMYVAIVIRYEDAKNLEESGRKDWLGGRQEEWRYSFSLSIWTFRASRVPKAECAHLPPTTCRVSLSYLSPATFWALFFDPLVSNWQMPPCHLLSLFPCQLCTLRVWLELWQGMIAHWLPRERVWDIVPHLLVSEWGSCFNVTLSLPWIHSEVASTLTLLLFLKQLYFQGIPCEPKPSVVWSYHL